MTGTLQSTITRLATEIVDAPTEEAFDRANLAVYETARNLHSDGQITDQWAFSGQVHDHVSVLLLSQPLANAA